jgi:asparagine synthase (glutamine-hydrolysing)
MAELMQTEHFSNAELYPFFRQIYNQKMAEKVLNFPLSYSAIQKNLATISDNELLGWISHAEITGYTQNVLLKDSDMCSMTHALEIRVPFFDHRLVEYVLGISDPSKRPWSPKKLLTDALGDLLPMDIINRSKMGFSFPWDVWLRNDLKFFVESRFKAAVKYNFIRTEAVQKSWHRYLSGDKNVKWYHIWNLVCLISWLESNIN